MATWFITGCSTGIGRATAQAAADAGHTVVATARRRETLDDLVAGYPEQIIALALDVTDENAVTSAVEEAERRAGGVDVVVNNAGIGAFATIEETPPADARAVMEANFWGAAAVTTAFLPHLRERRAGHIITISSIAGVRGSAGLGYYSASKWAVSGFMESLCKEVSHLGVKVSIVEPGPVQSQWIPSGTKVHDGLDDYAEVMDPYWQRIDALPGNQPGARMPLHACCCRSPRWTILPSTCSPAGTPSRRGAGRPRASPPRSTRGRNWDCRSTPAASTRAARSPVHRFCAPNAVGVRMGGGFWSAIAVRSLPPSSNRRPPQGGGRLPTGQDCCGRAS
ncbi:SDR family NAD(P)-dependent oxidoreductase [Demequina sp. SO4-13]|uniref:SDR family NAD(P)-dependent oxidoreductase n=1 Tax=Demequina sp. SO4-13 TaxID=3401027 RepID=UPI003AF52618